MNVTLKKDKNREYIQFEDDAPDFSEFTIKIVEELKARFNAEVVEVIQDYGDGWVDLKIGDQIAIVSYNYCLGVEIQCEDPLKERLFQHFLAIEKIL